MKQYKIDHIKHAVEIFKDNGFMFRSLPNGQFQIEGVNYWATSEKIYDPKTGFKGVGLNTLIEYLREVKHL